jgi:hypothetical protein
MSLERLTRIFAGSLVPTGTNLLQSDFIRFCPLESLLPWLGVRSARASA